jgi:hypothetical protein
VIKQAGDWKIDVWSDGWPPRAVISCRGEECDRVEVEDLYDLKHCVDRAIVHIEECIKVERARNARG